LGLILEAVSSANHVPEVIRDVCTGLSGIEFERLHRLAGQYN
jgi:hypothetical protein